MLKLSNIPEEVFEVACDYENIEAEPYDSWEEAYREETTQRGWTDGGLENAICDYLKMQGDFDEETGRFAGVNGYEI